MRVVVVITSSAALLLAAASASAQTASEDIRALLEDRQKVSIVDAQGRELRGRVADLSADAVTIVRGRERHAVPYPEIVKIDRVDDLKNGALAGLAVGAGLGLMIVGESCDPSSFFCGEPGAGNYVATVLILGGLGAAVGTGIDALIGGNRNIYQRGGGSRISLRPALGRRGGGALVAVSW